MTAADAAFNRQVTPPAASAFVPLSSHPARIEIRNLDFFYGDTRALKGVNLDFPDRQVTALIGPSGCGKSTLLRVLNRMYDLYPGQRATGEVSIDGENILRSGIDINTLRSRV